MATAPVPPGEEPPSDDELAVLASCLLLVRPEERAALVLGRSWRARSPAC
ncbi:hypothetical protein [Streptomyces sp. NPDC053069]